nr:hypothetical protein [Tanacetum cinerariifolium]
MAKHSQSWYNEETTWHGSSNNSNDITNITKRIDNLECDIWKLQENIHAIQVGCKIFKKVHLTKEHLLKEDGNAREHVKYIGFLEETLNKFIEESIKKQSLLDERIRKFRVDTDMSLRMLDDATKNLQGKFEQLTQEILTNSVADKAKTKMGSEMKVKKESVPFDLPNVNPYNESTIPHIQFTRHLKEQEDEAQAFRTLEGLKRLKTNRSLIRAVKRMPEYLMYVKDVFSSKIPIVEKDAVRLNDRCTMKEQSCIVNTNEKSEPFIQQLNPLPGISQSSKSSIKRDKKRGEITSPPSEGIDTLVLGSHYKEMEFEAAVVRLKRMCAASFWFDHGTKTSSSSY